MWRLLLLLCATGLVGAAPLWGQRLPPPRTVPLERYLVQTPDNLAEKLALDTSYAALLKRRAEWRRRGTEFNRLYTGREFPEGSTEAIAATSEAAWLRAEAQAYMAEAARFADRVEALVQGRIQAMTALARSLPNWEPAEVVRAQTVMRNVRLDGDRNVTLQQMFDTWAQIENRDGNAALAAEAGAGAGASLRAAGTQGFEDCSLFAVASASGRPYGLVAALAAQIVTNGPTRRAADRADPVEAIKRSGLDGYEVILLAEAFGQAELVPSGSFVRVLREGLPILIQVSTVTHDAQGFHEGAHEVVLSRTFQHAGETWFEMIDSNLPVDQRRYLSRRELDIVLNENGVAVRPEKDRTVPLLRP